jgi:hypothetical protein
MSPPITPFRTMPVSKAMSHIMSGIHAHWRPMLHLAFPWLALIALINIVGLQLFPHPKSSPLQIDLRWIDVVILTLNLIATASVAVSWHQFILRDVPLNTVRPFRVDRTVQLYFARVVLIDVACFVPLLVLVGMAEFLPAAFSPLILALVIQLGVVAYRISLGLPAGAINSAPISMKQSFEKTTGNNLRILGLLVMVHLVLAAVLLGYIFAVNFFQLLNPVVGLISVFILGIPATFFNMLLLVSLLTSLYGFFVEQRDF